MDLFSGLLGVQTFLRMQLRNYVLATLLSLNYAFPSSLALPGLGLIQQAGVADLPVSGLWFVIHMIWGSFDRNAVIFTKKKNKVTK